MNFSRVFGGIAGIAVFLTIFAYWARLTHQTYADTVLTIGMWSLAVSAGVYVYIKISSSRK